MASIYSVYTILKNLANKDEKGFITPQNFNTFAPLAQQNVVNDMFKSFDAVHVGKNRGADTSVDVEASKRIREDLNTTLYKSSTITAVSNVFSIPADFMRLVSARTNGAWILGQSTSVPIDILYDNHKLDKILTNDLSKPTETAPIMVLSDEIKVYPTSVKTIVISYYKKPQGKLATTGAKTIANPRFGYTVTAGKEIYSAASSIDFELPDHYVPMLVAEIAKMAGVNLSDADIYNYGNQEQQPQ